MTSQAKTRAVLVGVAAGLAIAFFARTSSNAGPADLSVVDAYASESTSDAAAVYVTLHNDGGADELIAVSSDAAARVTLHGPDMAPSGDLRMKAGADTRLEPGGSHIMLENLRAPLQPGDEVRVQLRFEHAAPIDLTVPVLSYDDVLAKVNP